MKQDQLTIGEWAVFSIPRDDQKSDESNSQCIGLVLGFSYLNGKTFKEREFSRISAPIASENNIGVLCSFYSVEESGILIAVSEGKHKFISTDAYVGTIPKPTYENDCLCILETLLLSLK